MWAMNNVYTDNMSRCIDCSHILLGLLSNPFERRANYHISWIKYAVNVKSKSKMIGNPHMSVGLYLLAWPYH